MNVDPGYLPDQLEKKLMPEKAKFSLIDLGDVSEVGVTLIKKVSQAVGGVFAPYQIKRVAKAEAEAAIIKAEADIKITDRQRRAVHRFFEEEARRQKSIEDITAKAVPQLNANAKPDEMEDDWVTNFFDKSRIVSDNQMQELWARILAGEANAPGTFSKRTVNFLSDLDKTDAELFVRLCSFGWMVGTFEPLVFEYDAEIYNKSGLNFEALSHLDSIGLVQYDALAGFQRSKLGKRVRVTYYGRPLFLEFAKESDNELVLGTVMLTKTGQELARICKSEPIDGFWEYVKDKWKAYNPKELAEITATRSGGSTSVPPVKAS